MATPLCSCQVSRGGDVRLSRPLIGASTGPCLGAVSGRDWASVSASASRAGGGRCPAARACSPVLRAGGVRGGPLRASPCGAGHPVPVASRWLWAAPAGQRRVLSTDPALFGVLAHLLPGLLAPAQRPASRTGRGVQRPRSGHPLWSWLRASLLLGLSEGSAGTGMYQRTQGHACRI